MEDRPAIDSQPQALLAEEKETVIFLAEYDPPGFVCYTMLQLCSRATLEDRVVAPPMVFVVTEFVKGDPPAKVIAVSLGRLGITFVPPKELKHRTAYTLRLTLSAESREYLREQQKKDGWYHLRVGDRLEVIEPELQ